MKLALLACLPLALAACGTIPVGSAPLPDVEVVVPPNVPNVPLPLDNVVIYQKQNYFGQQGLPSLVNRVSIQGRAEYAGQGDVRTVGVYLRPNLSGANCFDLSQYGAQYVVCSASGEDGYGVGTLEFPASQPKVTNFTLDSRKLIDAARAGSGYFGMKVGSGGVVAGDTLKLTNMRAVAKF